MVTGIGRPAVRRAAGSLDAAALRDRYAVATPAGAPPVGLPLQPEGRDEVAVRLHPPAHAAPRAAPPAASVYLGSFVVVAFLYSNPIVLAGAGAGVAVAGLAAGAGRALRASPALGR